MIKPHPTDPSKAILHGLTLAKTGGIPKWGLKIMSSFLPSYMKGMQVHEARRGCLKPAAEPARVRDP